MARRFQVICYNEKWLIRSHDERSSRIKSNEVNFDGSYLYNYTEYDSVSNSINSCSGTVESNEVPDVDGAFAGPIWLALLSGNYLQRRSDGHLPPVTAIPKQLRSSGYVEKAEWQLSDVAPFLPRSVKFHSDGLFHYEDKLGQLRNFRFPEPFDQGFVHQTFEVTGFTNYAGLELPLSFSFKSYAPIRSEGKVDLELQTTVQCEVTMVSVLVSNVHFPPLITGTMFFEDNRVLISNAISAVNLYVTNRMWPSLDDKEIVEQRRFLTTIARTSPPPKRHYLKWIGLIVIIAPIFIIWQLHRKTN